MANEETTKTNTESTDDSTGDQTSGKERFEVPACCRQMMAQMMGGICSSAEQGEGQAPERGNDSPGIFGRLMIQMMSRCCGDFTEKHRVAEKP